MLPLSVCCPDARPVLAHLLVSGACQVLACLVLACQVLACQVLACLVLAWCLLAWCLPSARLTPRFLNPAPASALSAQCSARAECPHKVARKSAQRMSGTLLVAGRQSSRSIWAGSTCGIGGAPKPDPGSGLPIRGTVPGSLGLPRCSTRPSRARRRRDSEACRRRSSTTRWRRRLRPALMEAAGRRATRSRW